VKSVDPLGGLPDAPAREPERPPARRHRIPATPTTVLLLAVLGAGFAAQVALGGVDFDPLSSFRLGSLVAAAIAQGDWYRLGSYAFLHGGAVHLLVNAWALWALMRPIEAALGPFAALGIFSGTAVAGGAASFAWSTLRARILVPAVGASGGIFGLFGAHCAIYLRVRKNLPPEARRRAARPLLANLLINVALAVAAVAGGLPLDNAAHVGGFFSGIALGAIAAVPMLLPSRPWHRHATVFLTLCAFALASMEGAAVAYAVRPQSRVLHARGAEAVVPWQVLQFKRGVGATADLEFELHLEKADEAPDPGPAKATRLGSSLWEERRLRNPEGDSYIELVQPESRLVVRGFCRLRDECAEDVRDALAEEVASRARSISPP
jgi:membrane associated rhomboid family serine protease